MVVIDDTSKALRAYGLSDFTKSGEECKMRAQTWLKKKMTDVMVTKAKFNDGKQIDGVITCDKVGEVKFIGMDRLISEGVK